MTAPDDETLIRQAELTIAAATATIEHARRVRHAAFYRMKQRHGVAETARRTNTTKSNVEYFALKGEALQ